MIGVGTCPVVELPDAAIGQAAEEAENGPTLDSAKELTRTLLSHGDGDDALAQLEAALDEHVDVWTPALHTTSRFELVSVLDGLDDAIGDVRVRFTESALAGSITFLGWQATGRFVRPAFLDDDHLLEPSGAVIRLAGAASLSFTAGGRAERIRCYYDRLALIEQMVASTPVANGA